MKSIRLITIVFAFSICLPQLRADNYRHTYAVIVAVADYQYSEPGAGDLRYTINDARLFYQFLRSPVGGAVPDENIVVLLDRNATRTRILAALSQTFRRATANDRVVFYFSGHGRHGYLLPYDVQTYRNLISYRELKDSFGTTRAKNKLCFIDACYANSIQKPARKPAPEVEGLNVAIMSSSQNFQTSQERGSLQQGVFSYHLIRGLAGGADYDQNKVVTIQELHTYVYGKVRSDTRGEQVPHTWGKFDLDMPVALLGR